MPVGLQRHSSTYCAQSANKRFCYVNQTGRKFFPGCFDLIRLYNLLFPEILILTSIFPSSSIYLKPSNELVRGKQGQYRVFRVHDDGEGGRICLWSENPNACSWKKPRSTLQTICCLFIFPIRNSKVGSRSRSEPYQPP